MTSAPKSVHGTYHQKCKAAQYPCAHLVEASCCIHASGWCVTMCLIGRRQGNDLARCSLHCVVIEILTRDSSNPGSTKPITQSYRIQLIQTHGTNDMTHRIKSNRTKRARAHVSTHNIQVSTDKTRRLVTKT